MPETESGIYYPVKGDPVLIPADMQKLAESVDTALGPLQVKPTRGIVRATANTGIINTEAFVTMVGTEKKIFPAVKSVLIVRAVFEFLAVDSHEPLNDGSCIGVVGLDGVDLTEDRAYLRFDPGSGTNLLSTQGTCLIEKEIPAGEHTIRLRAKNPPGGSWDAAEVTGAGTKFEYVVWPV